MTTEGRTTSWECGDPYSGIGCPEPDCTHRPEGWPENATMYAASGRVSSPPFCVCGRGIAWREGHGWLHVSTDSQGRAFVIWPHEDDSGHEPNEAPDV